MVTRFASPIVAMAVIFSAGVLALAGCSGPETSSSPGSQSPPRASASPSPSPMALAAYRQLLTQINTTLAADMRQLEFARTSSSVSNAATVLGDTLTQDARLLTSVTAPIPLRSAQAMLISALNDLSSDVQNTVSAASASQVCAGPSAVTMVSRFRGAAELRSAAALLAVADPAGTRIGSYLPPVTADPNRRLANGTLVKAPALRGLGQLTIDNSQNSTDTVVSLVPGGSHAAALAIYVRAGASATADGIADGSYQVYVTSGSDWSARQRLFTRDCNFEQLDQPVAFTTTATQYTTEQLTLYPVIDGNVSESSVPPDQFPAS